jgi:hypothetical protein
MPTSVFVWTPNDVVTLAVLAVIAAAMVAAIIASAAGAIRREFRKLLEKK